MPVLAHRNDAALLRRHVSCAQQTASAPDVLLPKMEHAGLTNKTRGFDISTVNRVKVAGGYDCDTGMAGPWRRCFAKQTRRFDNADFVFFVPALLIAGRATVRCGRDVDYARFRVGQRLPDVDRQNGRRHSRAGGTIAGSLQHPT